MNMFRPRPLGRPGMTWDDLVCHLALQCVFGGL